MGEEINPQLDDKEQIQEQLLDQAFNKILRIVDVLRSMGFSIHEHLINKNIFRSPTAAMGVPLVADGGDGIRASYDAYDGNLRIGFRNSFESWDNPRVIEVIEKLTAEGLWNKD